MTIVTRGRQQVGSHSARDPKSSHLLYKLEEERDWAWCELLTPQSPLLVTRL